MYIYHNLCSDLNFCLCFLFILFFHFTIFSILSSEQIICWSWTSNCISSSYSWALTHQISLMSLISLMRTISQKLKKKLTERSNVLYSVVELVPYFISTSTFPFQSVKVSYCSRSTCSETLQCPRKTGEILVKSYLWIWTQFSYVFVCKWPFLFYFTYFNFWNWSSTERELQPAATNRLQCNPPRHVCAVKARPTKGLVFVAEAASDNTMKMISRQIFLLKK